MCRDSSGTLPVGEIAQPQIVVRGAQVLDELAYQGDRTVELELDLRRERDHKQYVADGSPPIDREERDEDDCTRVPNRVREPTKYRPDECLRRCLTLFLSDRSTDRS